MRLILLWSVSIQSIFGLLYAILYSLGVAMEGVFSGNRTPRYDVSDSWFLICAVFAIAVTVIYFSVRCVWHFYQELKNPVGRTKSFFRTLMNGMKCRN